MKVPLVDLKRQYRSIKPQAEAAMARVARSGRFILGPKVEQLESKLAAYLGVKHAIGVASGTDALRLAMKACGVGLGDAVIVPSFTFFATAGAVHDTGATAVFADIDRRTYTLDPDHVARLAESSAKRGREIRAIIPVHLYGQPAELEELMKLAKKYDLRVIEDAAQAIGAEYNGRKVGTIGELGCFSFYPTKNLGAIGDGGLVATNDDELASKVRLLRSHGSRDGYRHGVVGTNSRLDELQAAILLVKLPHLDEWTRRRLDHAAFYNAHFSGIEGIACPHVAQGRKHVFNLYTIRATGGSRDRLRTFLKRRAVETGVYYPLPLHLQPCFRHPGCEAGSLPQSERACGEVLSLPIFPELTESERQHVVEALLDFYRAAA